ncbi:centromere protein C isoform X1 [Alligator sinensis]|uniref:Centromere protein C n=1 Tax=Alligator sinensis TaxID=38654 RepID=A0A1U7S8V1_ALLSI|nr:centromere protein C isoform X1 [Alligator sinensis]
MRSGKALGFRTNGLARKLQRRRPRPRRWATGLSATWQRRCKQQIDILPGQNVLKIIQDRFGSCVDDITTYSPNLTRCSTPIDIIQKEKEKIFQKSSGLFDLVTKTFTGSPSLTLSPVKTADSTAEQSLATHQKSAILKDIDSNETKQRVVEEKSSHDNDIADTKDLVASSKQDDVSEDVETTSQNLADTSEDEDMDVAMGSPVLLEEAKLSPVCLHTEIESLAVSQSMEEDQVAPMERVKCLTVPSEQKVKKPFSSALLTAMTTETIEKSKQQIDILPGQNVLKIIQDRFGSCVDDITTYSPNLTQCSTPIDIIQKEKEKILQKSSGLFDLVTKTFTGSPSLAPSPVKTTDSTVKQSLATHQKSAILKDIDSNKTKQRVVEEKSSHGIDIADTKDLVASSKQDDVSERFETTSQSPADTSEDEDIDVSMGSPVLSEEAKLSPVCLHTEIESLAVSQAIEEDQVAPMERVKCLTVPSEQKVKKPFFSALLTSMTTETVEKCYSAPVLPPAATPAKEMEIEHDCEFLIDESEEDSFTSWFSIPKKKKQTEKTKNDENIQKSAKTPNQKNTTALKQKDQTFTVPLVESSTNTYYRTREDSSGSSNTASHSSEQALSSKENHYSQNYYQSISKNAPYSSHKKQTDKQKLSEVKSPEKLGDKKNKVRKPAQKATSRRLRVKVSEESSVNQSEEEMNESELLQSDEVVIPSLQRETLTSASQKSLKLLKPKHRLNSLGSVDGVCIKSPAKFQESLQNFIDSTPNAGGGKRESAKSPRKASCKRTRKINKMVCSGPEDTETSSASVHEDSSLQGMAQQKCRKVDVSVKTKKDQKKRNVHRSQSSSVSEETMHHHSGPVQTQYVTHTSKNDKPIACELDSSSSDTFVESDLTIRRSLRHKLVKPSNTPNVRRTKRTRLKPLEYWRGERVNYMSRPSGGFVIAGVVRPVSPEKVKKKRNHHVQKKKHDRVEDLDVSLADASKPTAVWDPAVNGEVFLECISTGHNHSFFFKDESVEIYKHLNTSVFATGKLILKPLKEKGYQFIHMDKIAFHVVHGRVIFTLHEMSYHLSTGDFFYVPAGNAYNIRNLLNEDSILIFTQLKGERPVIQDSF